MSRTEEQRARAEQRETNQLLEHLITVTKGKAHLYEQALKMRRLLNRVPMVDVIDQYRPGDSMIAKAKALGVTRQALYNWLQGLSRPNARQAALLAEGTDFTIKQIRGR